MKTEFGFQVDGWGSLIMDKAPKAALLETQFISKLKERGLEGLEIEKGLVKLDKHETEERDHLIIKQDLGEGDIAKLIMRFAKRGANDLEISWRLFEDNPSKALGRSWGQGAALFIGGLMIFTGIIGAPLGIGCIFIPIGTMLIGSSLGLWRHWRKNTSASSFHQFDSRALAQTVDYVLMRVLAENGFSAADLRIVKKANIEGLGELALTDPADEMV